MVIDDFNVIGVAAAEGDASPVRALSNKGASQAQHVLGAHPGRVVDNSGIPLAQLLEQPALAGFAV